jgi:hypothetical protein
MDSSNRPLRILAAATLAILVALAGWLLYNRQPAQEPPPPPVPRSAPAPVAADRPAAASQATAPVPDLAGRILADGCRQGECRWSRVVRLQSVSTMPQGELRRLTARGGVSTYDPMGEAPEAYGDSVGVRWDPADRDEYIFCSRERPAFAFPDDGGGYIIHYLDLYSLAGYQLSSARTYMRVCHDAQFDGEDAPLLRRLGYRPGTRSEQVENGAPEDLTRF